MRHRMYSTCGGGPRLRLAVQASREEMLKRHRAQKKLTGAARFGLGLDHLLQVQMKLSLAACVGATERIVQVFFKTGPATR